LAFTAALAVWLRIRRICRLPFGEESAAVHPSAFLVAGADADPRGETLCRGKGGGRGTDFGNDLLRSVHAQAGNLYKPLDGILMWADQTGHLLVQLADLANLTPSWFPISRIRGCGTGIPVASPSYKRSIFGPGRPERKRRMMDPPKDMDSGGPIAKPAGILTGIQELNSPEPRHLRQRYPLPCLLHVLSGQYCQKQSRPRVLHSMTRAGSFAAAPLRHDFTPPLAGSLRFRGHLTPCPLHRHAGFHSFSFSPSPACASYYGLG